MTRSAQNRLDLSRNLWFNGPEPDEKPPAMGMTTRLPTLHAPVVRASSLHRPQFMALNRFKRGVTLSRNLI